MGTLLGNVRNFMNPTIKCQRVITLLTQLLSGNLHARRVRGGVLHKKTCIHKIKIYVAISNKLFKHHAQEFLCMLLSPIVHVADNMPDHRNQTSEEVHGSHKPARTFLISSDLTLHPKLFQSG